MADVLFRITLGIRFRRKGEGQHENVQKLLTHMLDGRAVQSLCGFKITADRGYGSLKLIFKQERSFSRFCYARALIKVSSFRRIFILKLWGS